MDHVYDVIVVGAGNGGLVSAATCAKAGLKTLVLEKHNLPGGCATSFVRGRFEFEASLHELCSVGDEQQPGEIYQIFKDLNADVDWYYEHTMFRVLAKGPFGYDVSLTAVGPDGKARREAFCDAMEQAVPGSRKAVAKIFKLVDKCAEAIAYITKMKGKPNSLAMITSHADFMRMGASSVEEVLVELGLSQKARNILCTYWGYLGVPTDELKAFHYFNMLDGYVRYGAAMPHLKSHELSEALAQVIYDAGGSIFYNSPVDEVLYNAQGKVRGVKVGEDAFYADHVVSNVIANNIWNMSPEKSVPTRARQLANARSFGISVLTIYLGMDVSAEELGVDNYTLFVQGTPDSRGQYDQRANKGFYIVNCLNKVVPDASEPGTCSLFFTLQLDGSDVPDDMTPQRYKKWKNAIAKRYIADYEATMGLDIFPHIEEIVIATPVTFARYLGTPMGTIYGYKTAGWDSILARISSQAQDNPVEGLQFVGGSATRGDGYSCAYITGAQTGAQIVAQMLKQEEEENLALDMQGQDQTVSADQKAGE